MNDCNGKPLAVGDMVRILPRWEGRHAGEVMYIERIATTAEIGVAAWSRFEGVHVAYGYTVACPWCNQTEMMMLPEGDNGISGCLLMKITPDADQFEHEQDREVEHG